MITLRDVEGGEPETFKLGDDVRNLEQVKVGDRVTVDVYRSTSIKALKRANWARKRPRRSIAPSPARSPAGSRPGRERRSKRCPASSRTRRSSSRATTRES
jgi:hypothetical protein